MSLFFRESKEASRRIGGLPSPSLSGIMRLMYMRNGIAAFSKPDKEQIADMLRLQEAGNSHDATGYTADNENALSLYKKAGFRTISVFDYYRGGPRLLPPR